MFGSLTSQPLSIPLRPMEPVNSNQNLSLLTNPATNGVVKVEQPDMGPTPLLPTKRKAATEPNLIANKRVVQVTSPRLPPQQSGLSKMSKNVTPKSKMTPSQVSLKVQHNSYETVRIKMRETLATAFSVGNQDKEIAHSTAGDNKPQYNYVMPDTDVGFDELLQGNGLSWDWDMQNGNPNLEEKNVTDSPQELAVKIELELFKLFGGVNKKYREKGRSLMFNLKDRSNPDLREKVLSSKITPERLCSMSPEELASKELSEWRMAKAEELDKMIVLPDNDGDMRRLVKKTHKGEYQIEVDQDDVSVEVNIGSSSLTRFPEKSKVKVKDEKNIVTDGNDLMQELIVDEFKDEGFLPPVVSLDEFMESLDSEPPFEDLNVNSKEIKGQSDNILEIGDKQEVKSREELSSVEEGCGECLWEGDLQLALSSTVPVIGVFKSGEKTSTKEWGGLMEIKGRVRLNAFEKFLKELPMSRSRAIMVVHFVLKDASSEYHQATLSEAMDLYVTEERVGFAEPSPGVEVYFCPPHKRTTDTLSRLLSKDHAESPENELIGVVIWRKANPNLSSHHKHHNRNHLSSTRQENINSNKNSNLISKSLYVHPCSDNDGGGDDDDDDDDDGDAPPGFGPGVVARDEDDLPEFSFSNSSGQPLPAQSQYGAGSRMNNNYPTRPVVAHMRQLVNEYGQNNITSLNGNGNGNGNGNRQWNQDDDDIPEWKPQLQNQHLPEAVNHSIQSLPGGQLQLVNPVMRQFVTPILPIQQPINLMQNNWFQPLPAAPYGLPPNAGQWGQADPRGRGF